MVDPRFCWVLENEQISVAKQELEALVVSEIEFPRLQTPPASVSTEGAVSLEDPSDVAAASTSFVGLQSLLAEKRRKAASTPEKPVNNWEPELEKFLSLFRLEPLTENEDSIGFWKDRRQEFPIIWAHAVDVLCCPASSAVVERLFSCAGIATQGRRNRLTGEILEQEIMLQQNDKYF
ncbi:MAG: hAT transposon family protein [PVC group bacterium]|nr:hAT transposon family protein [PVC group bacterium]